MKIKVFPRFFAECYQSEEPHIWISIYSTHSEPASLHDTDSCLGILSIQFDDIQINAPPIKNAKHISFNVSTLFL